MVCADRECRSGQTSRSDRECNYEVSMRHLELFSGIGGFRRAFDLLSSDGVMSFESIRYSEIDEKASTTYRACYQLQRNEHVLGDIVRLPKIMTKYALSPLLIL